MAPGGLGFTEYKW